MKHWRPKIPGVVNPPHTKRKIILGVCGNDIRKIEVVFCQSCGKHRGTTKHHLKPKVWWPEYPDGLSVRHDILRKEGSTIALCRSCHTGLHWKYTNTELRAMSKEQQMSRAYISALEYEHRKHSNRHHGVSLKKFLKDNGIEER